MKEFREKTAELMKAYNVDNLFKLDQPVYDRWFDAKELAKSGEIEKSILILNKLMEAAHENK